MARSTRLVYPDQEYTYILYGVGNAPSACYILSTNLIYPLLYFLLPITYFPASQGYPFTLQI